MYDAKRVDVIGRAPDDHADVIVEANEHGRFRAAERTWHRQPRKGLWRDTRSEAVSDAEVFMASMRALL